jgi:hypothetical protein
VVSREADILKSSRPTATRVSEPSVFEVASGDSFACESSAEVTNVRQVICGLPETAVDHEQEWEGPLAFRETQLCKVLKIMAVLDPLIKGRWRPLQDVALGFSKR